MASSLASMSSALLPLLLLLLLCYYPCHASGSGKEQRFRVVKVATLLPGPACSSPKDAAAGRNSLKVAHRRGPCSPGGSEPNTTWTLRQDLLRVESLRRRFSKGAQLQASEVSIPARWGTTIGTGNYIVTVGFGTPRKEQTVVFDTGSNVCWIQCSPCASSCYPQQEPYFDPTASSTYRNVSCGTDACNSLDVKGCAGGTCLYGVQYGDQSTTVGFLGRETLTLTPDHVFQDFLFGCGQDNQGLFGKAAGLMGLGRSAFSLVSQTSQVLGDAFSYCLPSTISYTGHLTIGRGSATGDVAYTPMHTDSREPSLYFIGLSGISVGGRLLPVSSTVFQTAGHIIDSGTVITRLPPSAYSALRSAFRSGMTQYPMAQPLSILDTCYDFSKADTITYPTVKLHFDGGTVLPLPAAGIFFVAHLSQVCLAFAGNGSPGDLGIIGNVQQRTTEVIYDVGAQRIGFATGACS